MSAGKDEETRCRFCNEVLPDWRPALTPTTLHPKPSVMSVRYRGVTHRIQYTPGPDGLESFLQTLQSIGIKVASASQVTFLCRSPDTGEEMALRGLRAFDAAAYCASITAAKRMQRGGGRSARSSSSDGGDMTAHPDSPTAASAAAASALRCHEMHGGPAAAAAAGGGAQQPAQQRVVAHVHAEAMHAMGGVDEAPLGQEAAAAAPAADHAQDAAPAPAARGSVLLLPQAASRRQQRLLRSQRSGGSHGTLWRLLGSLLFGARRPGTASD